MNQEKQEQKGIKEVHVYIPVEVFQQLKQMAMRNRRSMNGEIILAIEDRLKIEESK